jgi:hypothetical protein
MAPPARRPPRAGQWALFVVGGVVFLVAVAAGYGWLTRDQWSAAPAAPIPGPPVMPAAADPQAVMAELMQLAPELTPASAEMLVREVPNASGHGLAEIGWLMATRGFDGMERDDLRELGALIEEVYATLPPEDHAWMGRYLSMLRDGSLSKEDGVRGRTLFTDGVNKLPPERRQRLQALVEKAVRAGIVARRIAEGRTQEALEAPVSAAPAMAPPAEGAASPTPAAGSGAPAPGASAAPAAASPAPASPAAAAAAPPASPAAEERGEGYWRALMQSARARVARLRNQIADVDGAARREAVQGVDQKKRLEELARLRAELAEAERAVGEIEEQARAAGALPGWLRE